jgi:hypothetical protein
LCDLYPGLPQDDWFLAEMARGIDRIVPYSAAFAFDSKSIRWLSAIRLIGRTLFWTDLLRFEPGVQLLLDTVRRQPIDANVITQVKQIISDFESRLRDHLYLDFFQGLAKIDRGKETILSSLYSVK